LANPHRLALTYPTPTFDLFVSYPNPLLVGLDFSYAHINFFSSYSLTPSSFTFLSSTSFSYYLILVSTAAAVLAADPAGTQHHLPHTPQLVALPKHLAHCFVYVVSSKFTC
jgi:hypothetical protein